MNFQSWKEYVDDYNSSIENGDGFDYRFDIDVVIEISQKIFQQKYNGAMLLYI